MPEVLIYTTRTCPHCRSAKNYPGSMGIKFIERDILHDMAAAPEQYSANIMGAPAFKINGEFMAGFDRTRMDELLKFDIVKCPSCGQKFRLPAGKGKFRTKCRECSHKFEVTT